MPIYVYQVITPAGDGEIFEVQQSIADPALTTHPESGLPVQRVYTAPNLALKHSGPAQRSKLSAENLASYIVQRRRWMLGCLQIFFRDNPLAQLYTATETVAGTVAETAGQVAAGANDAAKGIATLLKWAPYVLAGIGAIGATAVVLAAANKTPQLAPAA